MEILLPAELSAALVRALAEAGRREIGGVLMGEHVGVNTFRVKEFTLQRRGGMFATFVRLVQDIVRPLQAFFRSTNHNYTKFNYLGEWHSHHSFSLEPSERDHSTMREIVDDPQFGAHFVVLLLVKLAREERLECSATIYQPAADPFTGKVLQEEGIAL